MTAPTLADALRGFVQLAEHRMAELGGISKEMAACLRNGRAALAAAGERKPARTFPGEMPMTRDRGKRYVMTGEHRPPRAGEFYISGAVPCAYLARHDLTSPYRIAREIAAHD